MYSLENYQQYIDQNIVDPKSYCIPLCSDDSILDITQIALKNSLRLPVFLICPFAESIIKYENFFLRCGAKVELPGSTLQKATNLKQLFVFNDLNESFAANYLEPAIYLVFEDLKQFFSCFHLKAKSEVDAQHSIASSTIIQESTDHLRIVSKPKVHSLYYHLPLNDLGGERVFPRKPL